MRIYKGGCTRWWMSKKAVSGVDPAYIAGAVGLFATAMAGVNAWNISGLSKSKSKIVDESRVASNEESRGTHNEGPRGAHDEESQESYDGLRGEIGELRERFEASNTNFRGQIFSHQQSLTEQTGRMNTKMDGMERDLTLLKNSQEEANCECRVNILIDEWDGLEYDQKLDDDARRFSQCDIFAYPAPIPQLLPNPFPLLINGTENEAKCREVWPKDITYNETVKTCSGLLQRILFKPLVISTYTRSRAVKLWIKWCMDGKLLSQRQV